MKFLADMGVSPKTVLFLQSLGHDAAHLHEQGLDRLLDSEIMEKARLENRVVLTHDLDFGDLLPASGENLPSVVIFRLKDMRPNNVNQYLKAAIEAHGDMIERGAILSISERRIRIRELKVSG